MKNQYLLNAHRGVFSDRHPFIPAVYEHKAWFIDASPSDVCRNADLFFKALIKEYETISPDALTIGIDVYNTEAEALGCEVTYYGKGENNAPAVSATGHLRYPGAEQFLDMPVPNLSDASRLSLNIQVAGRIVKEIGDEIPVRGAVSGPFSLAITLFGMEKMFILAMSEPDEMKIILQKCTDVIREYGNAFIDTGCDVVIFDSQASPSLISPEMYRSIVFPFHKQLIEYFQNAGSIHVPLIIGGDTLPIIDDYLATGANNILCDGTSDYTEFHKKCRESQRAYRRNIATSDFLALQPDKYYDLASEFLREAGSYPGFILGTGVVPYGTPTENILAIREAVIDFTSP
jgi:uroporphyrinogen decarboxylase